MKQPVIAIIGAGSVGSTLAYSLLLHNVAAKILMVDVNTDKCEGEVQDLQDALAISETSVVQTASLQEAGQADIIIITAGIAQKPGQTRLEILQTNHDIIRSVVSAMKPIKKSSIIITVTNPVDIITRFVQELSGLAKQQVFGSGTLLDTIRLRGFLAQQIGVNPSSIDAYVLGEHGDNQFVAWSTAQIGGVPLHAFISSQKTLDDIAFQARHKVYDIIAHKGFTAFGVASSLVMYCKSIIGDTQRIYPVSCFIEDFGVYLSMPAVLGLNGVEKILQPILNTQEREKLVQSADILNECYTRIR